MTKTKKDDGGPAFPVVFRHQDASGVVRSQEWPGLSLRDYFAGQALVGILGSRHGFLIDVGTDNAPRWAYRVADAMLAARASQEGGAER